MILYPNILTYLDGDWETIGAFKNEIQEVLKIKEGT